MATTSVNPEAERRVLMDDYGVQIVKLDKDQPVAWVDGKFIYR